MAQFSCERCRCYQLRTLVLTQLFLAAFWSVLLACVGAQNDITTQAPIEAPTTIASGNATKTNTTTAATTIKLGVYMESLCPDTRRFFLRQLVPTQREMGEIIELDLVPFGHARTLGNDKMLCQHGPRECEGNRRMACILVRSSNQTAIVETFACLLRISSSPSDCVAKNLPQLNFEELEKCTAGDESYQLMIEAEKKSGRLGYVPHLTVGGESSEQIQDQAEHHLKDYMCKLYTGSPQPEPCKNHS